MHKIKIAYVIDTIDYQSGGTERQLLMLLDHLNKNKYESCLCLFRPGSWLDEHKKKYNIKYFRITSFFNPLQYFNWFKFMRFLKHEKIDIVQTYFRDANMIGVIAGRLAGIKLIISTRRNQGYWLNKIEIVILKFLNKFTYGIIANSEAIKKFVYNIENYPESKIRVIYNGFDHNRFNQPDISIKTKSRRTIGFDDNIPVGIMVANLRPIKGIDIFLRAVQFVIADYPQSKFLIVGEGEERPKLTDQMYDLKIDKNIVFLGKREDISELLTIADLGILSSRSEGLSNAIVEYMATGLPVVCTDVGGNSEMVVDGENGYVVPSENPSQLANAIIKIFSDKEKSSQMGLDSYKRAMKMFKLYAMVQHTEDYYDELIEDRG